MHQADLTGYLLEKGGWLPLLGTARAQLVFTECCCVRGSNAPIAAQGRAGPAHCSDRGSHAGGASTGRTAPPIFQGVVSFRQGQGVLGAIGGNLTVAGFAPVGGSLGPFTDDMVMRDTNTGRESSKATIASRPCVWLVHGFRRR
jgi:hypothetical protein